MILSTIASKSVVSLCQLGKKKKLFFYIFTTLTETLEQSSNRHRPRVSFPELNTHKMFPSISNFGIYHFLLLEYKKKVENKNVSEIAYSEQCRAI